MSRLRYLWSLLDGRDAAVFGGVLGAALGVAFLAGTVTGAHRVRERATAACLERVEREDARWRAKGLHVVRTAMPCDGERRP